MDKTYTLEEALKAQKALRAAANLAPECFPIPAFVGMVSDEIEQLRKQGKSDGDIAGIIAANSSIQVTPEEIMEHYAPPEMRQHG